MVKGYGVEVIFIQNSGYKRKVITYGFVGDIIRNIGDFAANFGLKGLVCIDWMIIL